MRLISEGTHVCGDPGMQFDTTINEWHTCPNTDRIHGSNPCSEYMFLNDSACNLASINLMKFVKDDGEFDSVAYKAAIRTLITAQEIIVDNASYPSAEIGKNSHAYRPLGLGYANLGALLMSRGLPYDSDTGRDYAAALTALMTGEAYAQSSRIARDHGGPFAGYEKNREPFLRVMRKHRDAMRDVNARNVPAELYAAAKTSWDDAVELGEQHGYRNAQATVLAPTGTIGFMMDCDTTGVEPDIALVKYKKLVGGGMMKIVNQTVPMALRKLGYTQPQVDAIVDYIDQHETIEGAPGLKDAHLPVFDCAFKAAKGQRSIQYMGHIKMMGATQPFISGAISKTVNVPKDATVEDICQAYIQSWKIGAKAISIYRDGSKRTQPLNTSKSSPTDMVSQAAAALVTQPTRRKLPDERHATDAQVRHPGARGLHHGRPLRGRPAGRDLPGDGQGRLDHLGLRRRLRAGHLLRPAVRGAAGVARRQVQPRAVRAERHDPQPGHPVREVDRRLHLPLARVEVPLAGGAVPRRRERTRPGRDQAVPGCGAGRYGPRSGTGRVGSCREGRDGDAVLDHPEPGRCTAVLHLRLDHDPQRCVLQVHELRQYVGLRVDSQTVAPGFSRARRSARSGHQGRRRNWGGLLTGTAPFVFTVRA